MKIFISALLILSQDLQCACFQIARALVTVSAQFRLLDAVQQRYFASSVNDAKTKFVHQMMVECAETKEITPEHVARCMNVVKTQLNRAKEESSA